MAAQSGGGFDAAWQQIQSATRQIVIPAKCTECALRNLCGACPAASYAETGGYSGVPEYLCRKTNAYLKLLQDYDPGMWEDEP